WPSFPLTSRASRTSRRTFLFVLVETENSSPDTMTVTVMFLSLLLWSAITPPTVREAIRHWWVYRKGRLGRHPFDRTSLCLSNALRVWSKVRRPSADL